MYVQTYSWNSCHLKYQSISPTHQILPIPHLQFHQAQDSATLLPTQVEVAEIRIILSGECQKFGNTIRSTRIINNRYKTSVNDFWQMVT